LDVFNLRDRLIRDYASYIDSFIAIREPRIGEYVRQSFEQGVLWPEPLIRLRPSFEPGDRRWGAHPCGATRRAEGYSVR
jgi:hypothetical protein